jgi:RES domain-containing protein
MADTSATLSLATLEFFVHLEIEDAEGLELASTWAEIPETVSVETLPLSQLPANWTDLIAPVTLASIGDEWLKSGRTAVLIVPSAIIPQEYNYLLNPEHPDFLQSIMGDSESFTLDKRLWKIPSE